jgi:hypothetical protein
MSRSRYSSRSGPNLRGTAPAEPLSSTSTPLTVLVPLPREPQSRYQYQLPTRTTCQELQWRSADHGVTMQADDQLPRKGHRLRVRSHLLRDWSLYVRAAHAGQRFQTCCGVFNVSPHFCRRGHHFIHAVRDELLRRDAQRKGPMLDKRTRKRPALSL